ncbi:MAG: hypothetical protein OXI51_07015 [Chloroflexota bacterium]|nr:hypothetical protein [Chloroflexota bacterium]
MVIRARDEQAIEEFAQTVGEWLLAQRFGSIEPVAFRHYLGEPPLDSTDELPQLVIELTVEDPPPPPSDWRSRPIEEATKLLLWPEKDMEAVESAAIQYAHDLGLPDGIRLRWPLRVVCLERSGVERLRKTAGR